MQAKAINKKQKPSTHPPHYFRNSEEKERESLKILQEQEEKKEKRKEKEAILASIASTDLISLVFLALTR